MDTRPELGTTRATPHPHILAMLLAALSMIGPFAIDTFLPSFPAIAEQFHVSDTTVLQSLSVYLVAFATMSLFYGTLSDSFGRRRVILMALAVFSFASLGAAWAPSFHGLLAARAVQGLSAGAGMVIGLAIVRDWFTGAVAHRLMSHITMVFGLAPAIAPIIGGFLHASYGWRSVFVFMCALGVALWLMTWRFVAESLPAERRVPFHPASLAGAYAAALRNRRFVARALSCAFGFAGLALYIASAPQFVLRTLHLPETAFAWLFVPMIGGLVAGSSASGRLATRLPRPKVLRLGGAIMGVGAAWNVAYNAIFTATLPWAVLPIMAFTFGLGLVMPVMNLMTMEELPQRSGLAASLLNFIRTLIFASVSSLVAPLLFDSALALAAGMLVAALLCGICWWAGQISHSQLPRPDLA